MNRSIATIFCILLALIMFLPQEACCKQHKKLTKAEKLFIDASAAEQLNQIDKAMEGYRKTIEAQPNHTTAMFRLALLHDMKKEYDKSEILYKKILEINKNFLPAKNNLALNEYIKGNEDRAIQLWTESLKANPNQFDIYTNIGLIKMKKEENETALKYFDAALKLKPLDIRTSEMRAELLKNMGRFRDAEAQYSSNASKFSFEPKAKYSAAKFYMEYYNSKKAKLFLEQAIKMRNNIGFFYTLGAMIAATQNNFEKATEELVKANQAEFKAEDFDLASGFVNLKSKQYDEALKFYNKAVREMPANQDATKGLGELYIAMKQPQQAVSLWNEFISKNKNNEKIQIALSQYYLEHNAASQAETIVDNLLKSRDNDFRVLYLKGKLQELHGNSKDAQSSYKRSLTECPSFPAPATALALLLAKNRAYNDAISLLNNAINHNPEEVSYYIALGQLHQEQGNGSAAMSVWLKGLEIQGDCPELYYHLGSLKGYLNAEDRLRYYTTYLRLAPDGERAKEVRKKIAEIVK